MSGHIDPTREQFAEFLKISREGPIQMLNLVRFRAQAAYPDGHQATGAEAYRAYAKASAAVFAQVGGKQVWLGRFEHMLIGPADEHWDSVFIAEYPDASAFERMLRDPVYREAVKHRQAAVEDSRLIRLAPVKPGPNFGAATGVVA